MNKPIQRAVMMGLLIAASVGDAACLPPLGMACGDGWCPEGYSCEPFDLACIRSGCENGVVEADEECDDGNLSNEDDCLVTCKRSTCRDGFLDQQSPNIEECDDGNTNDDDDGCQNDCAVSPLVYLKAPNTGAG